MCFDIDRIVRDTFVARAEHHASIGSTNDRAAQCAEKARATCRCWWWPSGRRPGGGGETTAGGRGPAALAFSLLVDARTVGGDAGRSPLVALAAAVAVAEAVAPLLPEHHVGIRWPNDVMVPSARPGRTKTGRHPDRGAARPAAHHRHRRQQQQYAGRRPAGTAVHGCYAPRPRGPVLRSQRTANRAAERLELRVRKSSGGEPDGVAARADALCLQRGRMSNAAMGRSHRRGHCRGIAADGAMLLGNIRWNRDLLLGQPTGTASMT